MLQAVTIYNNILYQRRPPQCLQSYCNDINWSHGMRLPLARKRSTVLQPAYTSYTHTNWQVKWKTHRMQASQWARRLYKSTINVRLHIETAQHKPNIQLY